MKSLKVLIAEARASEKSFIRITRAQGRMGDICSRRREKVVERICSGKGTGNPMQDYLICTYPLSASKKLRPFLRCLQDLQKKLHHKQGQLVIVAWKPNLSQPRVDHLALQHKDKLIVCGRLEEESLRFTIEGKDRMVHRLPIGKYCGVRGWEWTPNDLRESGMSLFLNSPMHLVDTGINPWPRPRFIVGDDDCLAFLKATGSSTSIRKILRTLHQP